MTVDRALIDQWHRDGAVILPQLFSAGEMAAVDADCRALFPPPADARAAKLQKADGEIGVFDPRQFRNQDHLPFAASTAINLIGLDARLISFAKAALGVEDVRLYQCDAWAKFTGDADYDQPFHCDYKNHSLTVPGDNAADRTINFMIYVTDVTDDLGAIHFVANPDATGVVGPYRTVLPEEVRNSGSKGAALADSLGRGFADPVQHELRACERSGAAVAGSVFAYGIDVYHRGTNLTRPGGHRYTITASYKAAGNDQIGWMAWPFHFLKPWGQVINHASVEQLACLGIPRPGDAFWTVSTLARTALRWPDLDLSLFYAALGANGSQ